MLYDLVGLLERSLERLSAIS